MRSLYLNRSLGAQAARFFQIRLSLVQTFLLLSHSLEGRAAVPQEISHSLLLPHPISPHPISPHPISKDRSSPFSLPSISLVVHCLKKRLV